SKLIHKNLKCRHPKIAKDQQPASKRVRLQSLLAHARQAVNPLAEIHRLNGYQDAGPHANLDHASPSHNARLMATSSAVAIPLNSIRIRPRGPSNSTRHSGELPGHGAISSTNAGGATRREAGGERFERTPEVRGADST